MHPGLLERLEAGDRLGRHRAQRPGRHQVGPDAPRAEVPGEVPVGRLQAGLRDAHPVVDRPRLGGVEGRARRVSCPRPSAAAQATASDLYEYVETCSAVATSSHGAVRNPPPRRGLGPEGDRVQHPVEPVDVLADAVGQRRPAARVSVTSSSITGGLLRAAASRCAPPATAARTRSARRVAPCSWASRATENAIDWSVMTPVTSSRLPSQEPIRHCQWPMPRPPSTGITAPVT